jgi:hypothetical protein
LALRQLGRLRPEFFDSPLGALALAVQAREFHPCAIHGFLQLLLLGEQAFGFLAQGRHPAREPLFFAPLALEVGDETLALGFESGETPPRLFERALDLKSSLLEGRPLTVQLPPKHEDEAARCDAGCQSQPE